MKVQTTILVHGKEFKCDFGDIGDQKFDKSVDELRRFLFEVDTASFKLEDGSYIVLGKNSIKDCILIVKELT